MRFKNQSEMLKVRTEHCKGVIRDLEFPYILKKTINLVFAFINGRLQRCSLRVYSVESNRTESGFTIFHTFTVKRKSLDESYVDTER